MGMLRRIDLMDSKATSLHQLLPPQSSHVMSSPALINHSFGDHPLILNGHSSNVWSIAFSPSGQLLASGSQDSTIRLWNGETGACIATLNEHTKPVNSVAFSPDGGVLASGSDDRSIKLWSVESRAEIATLHGHSGRVWSVSFSPDGASLVSGSEDHTIHLWDVKSRSIISHLKDHSSAVHSVVFSPDGQKIASGSADKTVRLWNVASRTSIQTLDGHSSTVRSVAFSPSGEYLASGSYDNTIRLWNVATGAHIGTLEGYSKNVRSVAFSPNGKQLVCGLEDRTIRLWEVASRSHILTLEGHSDRVECVAFSPDGVQLASGANDNTIRIWTTRSVEAGGPPASVYPSASVAPTQNTTYSRQNATALALTSLSTGNDTARSISPQPSSSMSHLEARDIILDSHKTHEARDSQDTAFNSDLAGLTLNTTDTQQDTATSVSPSFPLNSDISESISLEGITLIGFGGFGDVFSGVHTNHGKVALKRPRRLLDEALIRRFLREVDLWRSVSHPHILACLGMCKIGAEVYVVSPFIENGDLLSCMARGMDLNRSKLLFEVAEALTHLHHRGIVHGDVKAQNILLSNDRSALLCDFGQAKAFDTMATSTESKGAGSVRWMAPELFLGEGRSMASDVYALGITIAEVLSGRPPYHEMTETLAVMLHVAYHDGRPAKEPLSDPEGKSYATLWETAEKCWVKDVKARPYMAQVLAMLFPLTRERN